MEDGRTKLLSRFELKHRYHNFGSLLRKLHVDGFRGIEATINFACPITAITGLNGAGKSTVGQLALCGYRKISTERSSKRFYVKDFFPVSIVDPTPFRKNASVNFTYETDQASAPQELTISRAIKEWSGYRRQPERHVEYIGLAFYIPKVERKDLTIYSASSLKMTTREELENAGSHVSRILGGNYEDIYFQGVQSSKHHAQLGVAKRLGSSYSENNMGFGEGRVIHTIRVLETCPEKSLVVLEEPETSLHENAQYEFSKYLVDVSIRRGHQIIFSTHSSFLLAALPPEARKMIVRDQSGVRVYDNLSSAAVRSSLSAGREGKIIVLVEDNFAKLLLQQLLSQKAPQLMKILNIVPIGDVLAVKSALKYFKSAQVKCFAILDPDQKADPKEGILKLPGNLAPEKEVFGHNEVKKTLLQTYGYNLDDYLAGHPSADHHEYSKIIQDDTAHSKDLIEADCIRAFLHSQGSHWAESLLNEIGCQVTHLDPPMKRNSNNK